MNKQQGAFLTIGELAAELNVPQHILRYWETRFPMLRPLQRAGNRRYYRVEDVELARRIHHLLYVEGYTVRGAQQALEGKPASKRQERINCVEPETLVPSATGRADVPDEVIARLLTIRERLASALA